MKKVHLPFDQRSPHYKFWKSKIKEFEWLKKYPRTLCWTSVKGLNTVEKVEKATCKKCLTIAENTYEK